MVLVPGEKAPVVVVEARRNRRGKAPILLFVVDCWK